MTPTENPTVADDTNSGTGSSGGSSGADEPCFDAETTMSCRVSPGAAIGADEAHRICFEKTGGAGAGAVLTPMAELSAGDRVLAFSAGRLTVYRVVVNQHKITEMVSDMLQIEHTAGIQAWRVWRVWQGRRGW